MKVMKKKIIYVLCILAVFLALLGLKKRNDTMYSSGVYHLNRSGIVEAIDKNIIVVRLDKLNEQDEDFKNVNTLQLDCRNCSYELENLKEGTKIIFYYFPYNADVRPLKVENIYVINEKESNIDLTEKAGQLFNSYRDKADESIYARGKSGGVITTKDIEQATEFYILAGYEQSDAEDKAVEYMLRRDATYQRAIAAGYSVSDDEINDYLDDLKLLQYDMLYGQKYIYGGENPFIATDLKMGTYDIIITNVYEEDGNLIVKGENFNKYSKIYINNQYTKTTFIDQNTIMANNTTVENESSIVVTQRTSGGGKLSSTNIFTYPIDDGEVIQFQ